jgi:hypothetical protein
MIVRGLRGQCGAAFYGQYGSTGNGWSALGGKKLAPRTHRWGAHILVLPLLAMSIAMAGCAAVGTKANAADPLTPLVSVSMMQNPPSSIPVGGAVFVSATVNNDAANAGVDWVAMCGSAPICGSFSPTHTASGAMTIFTAPIDVPSGNTVAVTALSTTDHSKASSATVKIISNVTGVTITQLPPSAFPSGGSLNVAATVAGDPSNAGVNWKATCGTVDCTSGFNGATHSPPGVATTFVVPLPSITYPTIVGSTVTLTAFATADHNFSSSTTFTVTSPISISITQAPPSTVLTNTSVSVAAVVTDDPTNSGVTWTILNCDLAPCGSWSATSSVLTIQAASGAPVTYTAPPTAVNHVNIQVVASASPTTAAQTVQISVTAPISIVITNGLLNNSIVTNASAPLVATVSHDSANKGVDWTVTCANLGACGSFSLPHTDSGVATTFMAPSTVPANNTVTIIATSTSDPSKTAQETDTVTAGVQPNSLLNGHWIMALSGADANGGPYALGGMIAGNGAGIITGGNLDLVDLGGGPGALNAQDRPVIAPGAYSIGTDGRGQIQLTLDTSNLNGNFGVNGTGSIVLSVVFVSTKHALLSESDSFGSGTGTLDLQNATDLASFQSRTSGLNGVYSLTLMGAEIAGPNPKYFVAGAVGFQSSRGSYTETSYIVDQSDNGAITSVPLNTVPHVLSTFLILPDPNGEMKLSSVNLSLPSGSPTPFSLNAWLIDANHFVVTDPTDSLFNIHPEVMIGYLTAQPSSTAISGAYAFTESGATASPAPIPQAIGGLFACGSAGTLDVTPLGGTAVINQAITAACSSPANANGRSLITISGAIPATISQFAAYATLDQGLYLIELDGGSAGTSGPSGAGVARQQTLPAPIAFSALSGKYASNFLANTSQGLETFAAQIDSNGVSVLSGTADVNSFNATAPPVGTGNPSSNAALSGSFTAGTNGRFPLALRITPAAGQPTPEFGQINPACYVVDANTCLLLGLDTTAPGVGILELQDTGL